MQERKKIIFTDNSLRNLFNFRGDIINHFVEDGYEVVIVAPKDIDKEISESLKYYPIELNSSGFNPFKDIFYFIRLMRIYRKERPKAIFHYTIKPNIYGSWASKILGLKNVVMVTGLGYVFAGTGIRRKIGRFLYKSGLRRADRVLLLNKTNYDKLLGEGYIAERQSTLFSGGEGINLSKFNRMNEYDFTKTRFLLIARVLYDKGYSEFVDAAAIVKKTFPETTFEILGATAENSPMGVPKNVLEKDISNGLIIYHGESNNVLEWLNGNGIVTVLPSHHEGMSRSLMEACAAGVPIITTNIPGCKELVDDGLNGYLVEPKNSESLAEAMIKFIELPEAEKVRMGKKGRQKAEMQFDVKNVIREYEKILENSF